MSDCLILWPMASAACLVLAALHLLVWGRDRLNRVPLLFALTALGAAGTGWNESLLMHTADIPTYHQFLRWGHIPIFLLLICMVWSVQTYFGTGRRWLAWTITTIWSLCLAINFLSEHNLVFSEITELQLTSTFGGCLFTTAKGVINPWKLLADLASPLILIYVIDASVALWRKGNRRRALIVGGSIAVFMLAAGLHSVLVDASLIRTPYMVGFAFMAIVAAMSFELSSDVVRAAQLSREVARNEKRWTSLLQNIELAVLGIDPQGNINDVNPFLTKLSGYPETDLLGAPVTKIASPAEVPAIRARLEEAARSGPRPSGQWTLRCASGQERQLVWSTVRMHSPDGAYAGLLTIGQDITDRVHSQDELRTALEEVTRLRDELERENIYLEEEVRTAKGFDHIIGDSDALKYVLHKVSQVADTDTPVLIEGETGVGKELVAYAIHQHGPRKERPFVKVNCASIPIQLMESELFGHEKGAFTGALQNRRGRFEIAHGGTLFLDEVGELPLELQPKLLRVLQDGELQRVGSDHPLQVDVRIIAATNRVLADESRQGRFREDLFYRLSVFPLTVPPLRQRTEDIPLLAQHFVTVYAKKRGRPITEIPPAVLDRLRSYSWPGNIRELQNVIERAVITSPGSVLKLADRLNENPSPKNTPDNSASSLQSLETVEREHIQLVLQRCHNRIAGSGGAAEILGINPSTLRSRMKKLGLLSHKE